MGLQPEILRNRIAGAEIHREVVRILQVGIAEGRGVHVAVREQRVPDQLYAIVKLIPAIRRAANVIRGDGSVDVRLCDVEIDLEFVGDLPGIAGIGRLVGRRPVDRHLLHLRLGVDLQ